MPDRKPRTSDGGPRNRTDGKPGRERIDFSRETRSATLTEGGAITVTDTLKPERPTRPERPPKGKDG